MKKTAPHNDGCLARAGCHVSDGRYKNIFIEWDGSRLRFGIDDLATTTFGDNLVPTDIAKRIVKASQFEFSDWGGLCIGGKA